EEKCIKSEEKCIKSREKWMHCSIRTVKAVAKRQSLFATANVFCKKSIRSYLPQKPSPDSSGSPLLCIGIGRQRLQRIAGRTRMRVEDIGSLKEL
ncbi:MAG: hypothetical protein WCL14_09280, partial [Bacteroidota bacterium]